MTTIPLDERHLFAPAIEEGLASHGLVHQANNIKQGLNAASKSALTETIAQNLVTAVFAHINKDENIVGAYEDLLQTFAKRHNNVRRILAKSVTRKGRCPDALRPTLRKILNDIEKEFEESKIKVQKLQKAEPLRDVEVAASALPVAREMDSAINQGTGAFSVNRVLGYEYNPLGSQDILVPDVIQSYQASLVLVKNKLAEYYEGQIVGGTAPDSVLELALHTKKFNSRPDQQRCDEFGRLAAVYSESGREDLFKFAASQYCFSAGRRSFSANQRKESRPYFQVLLHLYARSRLDAQRDLTWIFYHSLSYLFGTYNVYVPIKESTITDLAEKFYTNLGKALLETGRQRQFLTMGRCLLDIAVGFPWFLTDLINRFKSRNEFSQELTMIQKSLMLRSVFLAEPLTCFNLLARIELGNVATVLNRTSLSSADERRLVSRALIRFALDSNLDCHELLKGVSQQASADIKNDLSFAILVESLNPNLLTKGNEVKSKLIAETLGFPRGTEISEYFLARASELANLFHQFSRTSNPNLKGRYGYSILETIRLTRKWSVDRLKGEMKNEVIRFYRTVEGYVTTEQSKLIRDTNLEIYLASGRAVYSSGNTRITLEIRNVGEGTADGLELEVLPVEGTYNVEERFRTYAIDILSDKTPVQREVFIQPLVSENESIELSAVLRYNTLKVKNKTAKLNELNRTIWLYPETQFVRVPQPYNIGEPATTWFYGRQNLLETMSDNLHVDDVHDVSMIVYGLKRAGKTSVVKRFLEHTLLDKAFGNKYIPIYADFLKDPRLQNVKTDAEFLYFLISIINDCLPSVREGTPNFDLPSFKSEFQRSPFETFAFLLEEMLAIISPRRILIALDEFSTLQSKVFPGEGGRILSESLFGFISNTMQSTNQLTLIFTGTYMLLDMMREHTFDLAKICTPYMVGFLDDNAARQLVTDPLKRNPERPERGWLEYDPRVVDQIVTITNKHPFLIQYLCMQLVNRMNELKHNSVNLNDITSISDEVVIRPMHAPIMHTLWNEFDAPQHKVLSAVASRINPTQEWVDIDEIMYTFKEFGDSSSPDDVLAICSRLSDAELLEKSNLSDSEAYRITIPLYQMWLKQNKPPRAAFLN